MARKGWQNPDAGCPYYLGDEKKEIQCEGLESRSKIALRYERQDEKRRQMREFCCKCWERCEIYRMLSAMYEE